MWVTIIFLPSAAFTMKVINLGMHQLNSAINELRIIKLYYRSIGSYNKYVYFFITPIFAWLCSTYQRIYLKKENSFPDLGKFA